MGKFYGTVGYGVTKEIRPGYWDESVTERSYYGDVLQNSHRWENSGNQNDDLNVANRISIIADPFAHENLSSIRYVEWLGSKWKVTSVEVQWPRLILSLGGVYTEQQTGSSSAP